MADRYDAMTPRKGKDGKTYWTRIGSMWPAKDGKDGFNLSLDALPLQDSEGRCTISMFVPKPKEDGDASPRASSKMPAKRSIIPDDDMGGDGVPF